MKKKARKNKYEVKGYRLDADEGKGELNSRAG